MINKGRKEAKARTGGREKDKEILQKKEMEREIKAKVQKEKEKADRDAADKKKKEDSQIEDPRSLKQSKSCFSIYLSFCCKLCNLSSVSYLLTTTVFLTLVLLDQNLDWMAFETKVRGLIQDLIDPILSKGVSQQEHILSLR